MLLLKFFSAQIDKQQQCSPAWMLPHVHTTVSVILLPPVACVRTLQWHMLCMVPSDLTESWQWFSVLTSSRWVSVTSWCEGPGLGIHPTAADWTPVK